MGAYRFVHWRMLLALAFAAALPDVAITTDSGVTQPLADMLRGKAAAIQLVCAGCDSGDALQASLFRAVERRIAAERNAMLISISITPGQGDLERMRTWLSNWRSTRNWRALTVDARDVQTIRDAFPGSVAFVDRQGTIAPWSGPLTADAIAPELLRLAAPDGQALHQAKCASCHDSASLAVLATPAFRRDGRVSAYDANGFCAAITDGRDPAGSELSAQMPRLPLTASECRALWSFVLTAGGSRSPLPESGR